MALISCQSGPSHQASSCLSLPLYWDPVSTKLVSPVSIWISCLSEAGRHTCPGQAYFCPLPLHPAPGSLASSQSRGRAPCPLARQATAPLSRVRGRPYPFFPHEKKIGITSTHPPGRSRHPLSIALLLTTTCCNEGPRFTQTAASETFSN